MRQHINLIVGVLLLIYSVTSQISLSDEMIPTSVFLQKTPWAQSNSNKRLGCKSVLKGAYAPIDCICSFLEDQINMHATPEFSLAQTYRIGWDYVLPQGVYNWGPVGAYYQSVRADVYDNALAAIMLMNSGQMESAKRICDTLVLLVNLDKNGDGRTRSAYYHTNPIQRDYDGVTPITYGTRVSNNDVIAGNMAFQIIALGRWYHHTQDFKYLQAAIKIAKYIQANLKYDSAWGGFTAGVDYNATTGVETKLNWRSTEHNFDIYAAARLLYGLTNDDQWQTMMNQAKGFVNAMFEANGGYYYIGAADAPGTDTPVSTYPTCDAQTWNALSEADDDVDRKTKSLLWVLNNLQLTEYQQDPLSGQTIQYDGVQFSLGGTGIQSEQTAGTAMAFYAHGTRIAASDPTNSKTLLDAADKLLSTLLNMQTYAVRGDGHGIVAAVNPLGAKVWPGDESTGESWRYYPLLHTAATSWTGLALHFMRNKDAFANPYADYSKKQVTKYITTGVASGQVVSAAADSDAASISNSINIGIATLVLSLGVGFIVLVALVVLALLNLRLYRKNKDLEEMDQGNSQEMFSFNRLHSTSTPGTPNPDQ